MSKTWTNTTKCCATCANWGGARTEKYGSYVETDGPGVKGKCYAGVPSCSTQGKDDCDGFNCSEYKKWTALR